MVIELALRRPPLWLAVWTRIAERNTRPRTDGELVRAALRGDRNAYRQLFDRHAGAILGFIQRSIRQDDAAEDLLQEVFIRAFRNLDRFRAEASFRTWLFTIARNRVSSYCVQRQRQAQAAVEPAGFQAGAQEPLNPFRVAEGKETLRAVERAIARLKPKHREVFLLRHVHGLSYPEISSVLKVPLGTVKSRLLRALNEFKRYSGELER